MISIQHSRDIDIKKIHTPLDEIGDTVDKTVDKIILDVKTRGDEAVLEYTRRFDHADINEMRVSEGEISQALSQISSDLYHAMKQAAENIRAYHEKQVREGYMMAGGSGVMLGQRIIPLDRVGLYIPGGTAAYPSTLLMNAIPAKIAGVRELVLATPPRADGIVAAPILAAAHIADVDSIYKMGGAQAIAAMAYGTETVPRVDKITGPGNIYVATAKKKVFGQVAIDMIAGPSEILVIADDSANPRYVAADLLSQAEHDTLAASILVTTSVALAESVNNELEIQLKKLTRVAIAEESLKNNGRIILTDSMEQAVEICNAIAPEHLELCVEDPFALLGEIRHAGSVFLGHYAPEALGDYLAGTNHTLPTNGAARFSSPLSVDDFVKKSSYIYYTQEALRNVEHHVRIFAQSEGLQAHAYSMQARFEKE